MPAAHLHLHLFGLFRLLQDDQPIAGFDQACFQQLLAYLVLHRAAPISRQQLAFLFWPDSTGQQARKNLRTLPTRLCALPDADCILSVASSTVQAIDKIMGESDFRGMPNDLVWADRWQAEL